MKDVTDRVSRYRTCVRSIWNDFFADDGDWDARVLFEDACTSLFRALVLYDIAHDAREVRPSYSGDQRALSELRVQCVAKEGVVVSKGESFRDVYPTGSIYGITELDLSYVDLWDPYPLARREFEFVCAEIVDTSSPLRGSKALIPFEAARVFARH
jgi:hypothetical protein